MGKRAGRVGNVTKRNTPNQMTNYYGQDERTELMAFIRLNDANGFETLEGDESIEQLREAVESIKNQ